MDDTTFLTKFQLVEVQLLRNGQIKEIILTSSEDKEANSNGI